MKRWISILLTLLMVFSLVPGSMVPALAEDAEEVVGESIEAEVFLAEAVDAEGLVVGDDAPGSPEELPTPDEAQAAAEAEAAAVAPYGRVTAERTAVLDSNGAAFAEISSGSVVLITGEAGALLEIAFNTEKGVVTGLVDAGCIDRLSDDEAIAFVDALAASGEVALYNDNLDTPLATVACAFAEPAKGEEAPVEEPEETADAPVDADADVESPTADAVTAEAPQVAEAPVDTEAPAEDAEPADAEEESAEEAPGETRETVFANVSELFDINAREKELPVGSSYTIEAVTCDGAAIDKSDLIFASSDEAVASVSAAGVVTAMEPGDADISVTYQGEMLKSAVKVPVQPTSLALSATSLSIGLSEVYTGLRVKSMAPEGSASTITWSTSNKRYVKVDARTGAIKGVKRGSAYIYAKAKNGVWARCKVTVKKKPSKISLPKTFNVGLGLEGYKIKHSLKSGTASAGITWASNNKAVVEVDPTTGILLPRAVGSAKITARTYNGKKATCTVNVRPAPTGVSLRPTANVTVGKSIVLTPTMAPSNAIAANTYQSSDPSVATVDNAGRVTGRALGTAIITATTYNGITSPVENSCVVTVCTAPSKVTLNKTSIKLGVGDTFPLIASVPQGSNPDVTWSTSKKKYATVNGSGVVKAVKKGKAKITVKTTNGKKATCTVTVVASPTSISRSPTAVTLCEGGMSFQLKGSIKPSGSKTTLTFTSSNPDVATVSAGGLITTVRPGVAVITVSTHNGKKATCAVAVKSQPSTASFGSSSVTLSPGQTYTPSVTVMSADGSTDVYRQVTYATENASIATVNASTGVVTAKASGTTTVTATTHNGICASMEVDVTAPPAPTQTELIEKVIALAVSQLGKPYIYGSGYHDKSPTGFDCSGLTTWAYYWGTDKAVDLKHTANSQGNDSRFANKRVYGWQNCVRGDILCFKDESSSSISHVGLYLGNGKFIHASNAKSGVIYSYFNSGSSANYWQRNLVWGYHVF